MSIQQKSLQNQVVLNISFLFLLLLSTIIYSTLTGNQVASFSKLRLSITTVNVKAVFKYGSLKNNYLSLNPSIHLYLRCELEEELKIITIFFKKFLPSITIFTLSLRRS